MEPAKTAFERYDFGGAGWPNVPYGVRDFKASFGGELVCYGRYRKVYSRWKMALAERAYELGRTVISPKISIFVNASRVNRRLVISKLWSTSIFNISVWGEKHVSRLRQIPTTAAVCDIDAVDTITPQEFKRDYIDTNTSALDAESDRQLAGNEEVVVRLLRESHIA